MAFEAYRDLVKLRLMGLSEEAGLQAALLENVELRANAVSTAAAAAGVPISQSLPKREGLAPSPAFSWNESWGRCVGIWPGSGGGERGKGGHEALSRGSDAVFVQEPQCGKEDCEALREGQGMRLRGVVQCSCWEGVVPVVEVNVGLLSLSARARQSPVACALQRRTVWPHFHHFQY